MQAARDQIEQPQKALVCVHMSIQCTTLGEATDLRGQEASSVTLKLLGVQPSSAACIPVQPLLLGTAPPTNRESPRREREKVWP